MSVPIETGDRTNDASQWGQEDDAFIATATAVSSPYINDARPYFEVVAPATLPEVSTILNKLIFRRYVTNNCICTFIFSGVHVRSTSKWSNLYGNSSCRGSGGGADVFSSGCCFGKWVLDSRWTLEGE
jgi:hypothetical protein